MVSTVHGGSMRDAFSRLAHEETHCLISWYDRVVAGPVRSSALFSLILVRLRAPHGFGVPFVTLHVAIM